MCGFVGFTNCLKNSDNVILNMIDKISHRGPDDRRSFIDNSVALGFCRLSIVDVEGGIQPMFNEDRTKVLVFNGEIYNSAELKEELIKKGHIFANNSDSEVLIHAYEQWNYSFLSKLRGMFAFLIYDIEKQTLFGARDFFGIKPFYYYKNEDDFFFGSEIKAFLNHPNFKKQLNLSSLEQFLSFQYSVGEETFFKNVFKLPPAHWFTYNLKTKEMKIKSYFNIEFKLLKNLKLNDWIDQIDYVFKNSVEAHKMADVKIGSLLSSGIDSSLIANYAKVKETFTVGFVENGYSEINYARQFSNYIGVKNYSKKISAKEFWTVFPKIQYYMDEPLADPSAVALYFACKTASKHVKVIMSGEGADELFGGYNVYKDPVDNFMYYKIPFFIRNFFARLAHLFGEKRGFNYFIRHGTKLENRYIGNANIFNFKERCKMLNIPSYAPTPADFLKNLYNQTEKFDDVTKMQYIDLNTWLVGDILQKADKMSMANSIELRVPFLDKKVFEVASSIPVNFKVNRQNTKFALRCFAQKQLPKFVAQKKKLGFPVPIRVWLRQKNFYELVLKMFRSDRAAQFFNQNEIINLLNLHFFNKLDGSRKIWTLFSFLIWHNQFFC